MKGLLTTIAILLLLSFVQPAKVYTYDIKEYKSFEDFKINTTYKLREGYEVFQMTESRPETYSSVHYTVIYRK